MILGGSGQGAQHADLKKQMIVWGFEERKGNARCTAKASNVSLWKSHKFTRMEKSADRVDFRFLFGYDRGAKEKVQKKEGLEGLLGG